MYFSVYSIILILGILDISSTSSFNVCFICHFTVTSFPLLCFADLFKSYKWLFKIFPLGTSASHCDGLDCIRPTWPFHKKYKTCNMYQIQLWKGNRVQLRKPQFYTAKILERRRKCWQESDIFCHFKFEIFVDE